MAAFGARRTAHSKPLATLEVHVSTKACSLECKSDAVKMEFGGELEGIGSRKHVHFILRVVEGAIEHLERPSYVEGVVVRRRGRRGP